MNLREINSTDLAAYHIFFHDTMAEVVSLARHIGGDGSVINLTLKGPNLKSDVTGVLTPSNNYDVNIFIDQISRILQSDDQLMSDDQIEIQANIAMNRQGGGTRRKLVDLSLNEVIKRKKMSLFCPMNVSNKLCFSICLARFLNPQLPESELESCALSIHNNAGFSINDPIALHHIGTFEKLLDIKIVVIYRTSSGGLETYKNHDEPHPRTVFLYLHDEHFYMILNLTAFIGSDYVCEFCYKGYNHPRNHHCKYACNVFQCELLQIPKKNRTLHRLSEVL